MRWLRALPVSFLLACAAPMLPCEPELRYVGRVAEYTVVCRSTEDGSAIICGNWPEAPDSVRLDFWYLWSRGQLDQVEVCEDLPVTDTPVYGEGGIR